MHCLRTMKLEDFSDIAQIIIAVINLIFVFFLFIYQRRRDNKSDFDNLTLYERSIKLQWFKDLIIQPKLNYIYDFFKDLSNIKNDIDTNDLSEDTKQRINTKIKNLASNFRKEFIDILNSIDKNFKSNIQDIVDNLVDDLTKTIIDDDLELNKNDVFEKNIYSKIISSENSIIALIYNYKCT